MRFNYDFTVDPAAPNMTACDNVELRTLPLSGSSQFFVAVGVLTLIYVLGATLVYILFITPELFLAKWLVIGVSVGVRVCVCVKVVYIFC